MKCLAFLYIPTTFCEKVQTPFTTEQISSWETLPWLSSVIYLRVWDHLIPKRNSLEVGAIFYHLQFFISSAANILFLIIETIQVHNIT